jgi:hypothetical protein
VKYLNKRFTSPANSTDYVDNWDAIFGKDEPAERESKPDVSAETKAAPERGFWSFPD